MANLKTGLKQSAETVGKRSQALRSLRADPERNASWSAAAAAGLANWLSEPENAATRAARASDRMKRLHHSDQEFQDRRDKRASLTLKKTWEVHRDKFVAATVERYWRDRESGKGLSSEDAKNKKAEANSWIMKQAHAALRLETDYNAVYTAVQATLRREMPYDGPLEGSDYMDYLQKLGTATVSHPECRAIADAFLSEAIPRFADQWKKKGRPHKEPPPKADAPKD